MRQIFVVLLLFCFSLQAEKNRKKTYPIKKEKSTFSINKEKASNLVLETIKKDPKNKNYKIELVSIDFPENIGPQYVYYKLKKDYNEWIITYKINNESQIYLVDLKTKKVKTHNPKAAQFINNKNKK